MADRPQRTLMVSATFTAEPVEAVLAFWTRELELDARVGFAPYGQVFPQLLDPASELSCNPDGLNVILLRIEDLDNGATGDTRGRISELIGAVDAAATRCPAPLLVISCPPSADADHGRQASADAKLTTHWSDSENITFLTASDIAARYPVEKPLNEQSDDQANIPYSDEFFAALASEIARRARLRFSPPHKVIVLDCDNTLWSGACAEEGTDGISVGAGHRAFHQALIEQQRAGVLLTICSKNRPQDVHEAFREHPDIHLDFDQHVVAERINWERKSKNIAELADELNLGLDSFLFIDDNPVECAEVRAELPQVLCVQAPADPADYPEFIAHVWPFDRDTGTGEDAKRTALYKSESERKRARNEAPDFSAFLNGLNLQVDIEPAADLDFTRIAQLTQRTNQFNAAPEPLTEAQLSKRIAAGLQVLAVRVKDRFGDYGLVGALMINRDADVPTLEGFFLSCRVLGRGVEHEILNHLTADHSLRLRFRATERNEPVQQFLDDVPVIDRTEAEDGSVILEIPAGVKLSPNGSTSSAPASKGPAPAQAGRTNRNETLARIPSELNTAAAILARVKGQRRRRPDLSQPFSLPKFGLEQSIASIWEEVLGLETVGAVDPFSDLGGRSLQLAQVHAKLSADLGIELPLAELFGLPTIRSLADRIEGTGQRPRDMRNLRKALKSRPDIAIVGMSLRVPGAQTPEQFWQNLRAGVESILDLSDEQLAAAGIDPAQARNDPKYIARKGTLPDIDQMDAAFFGILPKDAEIMDPQQRLFLELSHEAIERAGYDSTRYPGKIGVYAGAYLDTYLVANICRDTQFLDNWIPDIQVGALGTELGNDKDYLATRVAYKLNLRGPSMTLQTACSTSLVAIAQACQSLVTHQTDMALAGGVTITVPQDKGYTYQEGGILSPDGHCRAFDHRAAGTVFSNGGGAILLKRLGDAIEDGDQIHGVIKGFALNNDGGEKHSYTAPSVDGQADVIRMAQKMAQVEPETITLMEAHGTGTSLGDPIEVAGLTQAFREGTDASGFCALGSVKPNIGHLDVASGVTAVNKICMALSNGEIPPLVNFEAPNPKIDFKSTPFYVSTELKDWLPAEGAPRRAGVSSFGVGGTNAHLVIEEAPTRRLLPSTRSHFLFALSAKTATALETATDNLRTWLEENPGIEPDDAAFTLQVGRQSHAHRRFIIAGSSAEAAAQLAKGGRSWQTKVSSPPIVFMFPGQGAQKVNMARDLYQTEPYFRDQINTGAEILKGLIDIDVRDIIFPPDGLDADEAADALKQTVIAQPAIFLIENALARLWMRWGVQPDAMIGHSVGEFAAACIAGVFTFEEGLNILAARGRLMGELPGGCMLSVRCSEAQLQPYLNERIELAAVNGPELCVAAGPEHATAELITRLEADGITAKPLHTSHAFHSWMMDPVIKPFAEVLAKADLKAPQIPIFSTVTAAPLSDEQATDPTYWARHLRNPVRFLSALEHFWENSDHVLLEVGPGNTLATLARQNPDRSAKQAVFASSAHAASDESDAAAFLAALGNLWANGVEINWDEFYAYEKRGRVVLPTYPFERKRFWREPKLNATPAPATPVPAPPVAIPTPSSPPIFPTEPMPQAPNRTEQIEACIKEELSELSGFDPADLDRNATFLELGFDSLLLTQVSKAFETAFGVKVTLRDLLDEHPSIAAMATYLDQQIDPALFAAAAPEVETAAPVAAAQPVAAPAAQPVMDPAVAAATAAQQAYGYPPAQGTPPAPSMPPMMPMWPQMPMQLADPTGQMAALAQQVQALSQQVANLAQPQPAAPAPAPAPAPVAAPAPTPASEPAPAPKAPEKTEAAPKASGPGLKIDRDLDTSITERQRKHIADLVSRYTSKTSASKELTQRYRHCYADPRTASGFNRLWKEMCYQIVVEKSAGSRLLDRDGNEYIDLLNGFGPGFLGHSPDFVTEALHAQIDKGFEVGPQSPIAGEVAELFCSITGNERASFVNTGSEAVQAAMRLARTVTGRDKIVLFAKDYHGNFDEVLVRGVGSGDKARSLPSAPGIPRRAVEDIIVLPYGTDEAMEVIKKHAHELAAVLVEPVQSRRPEFQPIEFVRELREVTANSGTLLVFDEVITGFRTGPGGAQSWFGVEADLATYGKVVGGGMPIGVVAGKAEFMDTFDGGFWQYGDDSFPEKPVTFFAGTFVRHPLAMTSAKATLEFLRDADPSLWDGLRSKANHLAGSVDKFFVDHNIPIRMPNFGSQMFVRVGEDEKYANLLFYHLREKGVFILDSFPSYMTISHSDEEVEYVINAFKESATELVDAGFFADAKSPSALPSQLMTGAPRLLGDAPVPSTPPRENTPRTAPTTEAQKEILIASRTSAESSCAFNEPGVLTLKGDLKTEALTEAINDLLSRHDALRAHFPDGGEEFIIDSEATIDVPVEDIGSLSEEDREQSLRAAMDHEATSTFNLEHGPLVRAKLFKTGNDEHQLLITAHHLVCDGWSFNVLVEELGAIYSSKAIGEQLQLEEAPEFAEYARQKLRETHSESRQDAKDYWLGKHEGVVAESGIPTDRPRMSKTLCRAAVERTRFDQQLIQDLRKAGAAQGATLYSTVVAGFQALLHRLSGDQKVILGIPAAGQTQAPWESLVGHCVDFLPLLSEARHATPFSEHLTNAKTSVMEAFDHRAFGYGEIMRALSGTGREPKVEFVLNLERMDAGSAFGDLDVQFSEGTRRFSGHLIFANLIETPDGLEVCWHYNTELFDAATIRRWMTHFETLLQSAATDPDQVIGELQILSDAQRQQIVRDWNDSGQAPPPAKSIQQLFSEQAAATPKATALVWDGGSLSYAEIEQHSNAVASRLIDHGCQPGDRIAVYLERSPQLIVSLLGILKAGAAYLPIEPEYPAGRIDSMLKKGAPKAVITSGPLAEKLPENDLQVLFADDVAFFKPAKAAVSMAQGAPDDLAYVIFTSGSTGEPKGVAVPHRGVVRLVKNTDYANVGPQQTWLQAAALSFDASTLEIWAPLLNGGTLALLPAGAPTPNRIANAIEAHGVTSLWLTSGLFQLMIDECPEALSGLKQLLAGGDVLSVPHVRKAFELLPDCRLINGYGPSENTTFTSCHTISPEDLNGDPLPIGKPIAHTQIYILDQRGNPVPIGVAGELCTGGEGLALGYLNDPERTAKAFLPSPLPENAGETLYRTGDLCRYRADGSIEFLGRGDGQVKIRGFRIERGEIEAAITRQPGVARCAVAVLGSDAEDKSLAAYVVATEPGNFDPAALRKALRAELPHYLVPNSLQEVDALPLNGNGKVDYRALPAPDATLIDESPNTEPDGETEIRMQQLWQEVLATDSIGAEDDFFDLGGHSLLGLRLITRIEKTFDQRLPLAALLESPTIRGLARQLDDAEDAPASDHVFQIQKGEASESPLFAIHGGDGGALFYRHLLPSIGSTQPLYGIESPLLRSAVLDQIPADIASLAASYIEAIRPLAYGRYRLGGFSYGGVIAYEMAQQLRAAGEEVELVALFDTCNPAVDPRPYSLTERIARNFKEDKRAALPRKIGKLSGRLSERKKRQASEDAAHTLLEQSEGAEDEELRRYQMNEISNRLMGSYEPAPYDGPVTLFKAAIPDSKYQYTDHLGWEDIATNLRVSEVPGSHLNIFDPENASELGSQLRDELAAASEATKK